MNGSNGFLLIDKPGGVSSFAMVRKMRAILSIRKAGHAGTLDPMADGLLVLAFGKATRLIRYLPLEPKVYEFTITFGTLTDTLDAEGTVVTSGGPLPGKQEVIDVLREFSGEQMQVPPAYSALKVGGKRSYALAREGKTPEHAPRKITIQTITLTDFDDECGTAKITVTCSGGTYVRALARDIAEKLGTVGYASAIRRTRAGIFDVAHAYYPDKVTGTTPLISPEDAFSSFPRVSVSGEMLEAIRVGKDVCPSLAGNDSSECIMAFDNTTLVAVLKKNGNDRYHPDCVLSDDRERMNADS